MRRISPIAIPRPASRPARNSGQMNGAVAPKRSPVEKSRRPSSMSTTARTTTPWYQYCTTSASSVATGPTPVAPVPSARVAMAGRRYSRAAGGSSTPACSR